MNVLELETLKNRRQYLCLQFAKKNLKNQKNEISSITKQKKSPNEVDPFFCINMFGLTVESQMGKINIDVIDKVTRYKLTDAQVTISVLLDGIKHVIVNNGTVIGGHSVEFIGTYTAEEGFSSIMPRSAVSKPNTLVPGLGKSISTTE